MLKVHVWRHKDGDHLAISKVPWWYNVHTWIADRLCPCCGLIGFTLGRWEWFEEKYYPLWSSFTCWTIKSEKELYRVPIENGCHAAYAIWNSTSCWHDEPCLLEKE